MKKIWIVGNILKDVYLRLDEGANNFENDGAVAWLDVEFNEQTYPFFRRHSVYGGAAVSLEVLTKFGVEAQIAGAEVMVDDGRVIPSAETPHEYRYILCHDNDVAYLTASERMETTWVAPQQEVDWIFVDRSAKVTTALVQDLKKYLESVRRTRLAVHLAKEPEQADYDLLELADLVFTEDTELDIRKPICVMNERRLRLGTTRLWWHAERAGLLTHLTTYSVVAAAVLGALANRRKPAEALRLAKVTAENMSLDGVWNLQQAEERLRAEEAERADLQLVAAQMVAHGKGILAADESGGSTARQFSALDIVDDEQHRRDYRNILFTTPDLDKYVNAVILFDETTRQLTDEGQNFVDYLISRGIVPGVKVDKGLVNYTDSAESYPAAVPDLAARLHNYYKAGLRFAKWRCALYIGAAGGADGGTMPSDKAIAANVAALAEYARTCQDERIVPIVEPEVVYDGNYDIETCAAVTGRVLDELFAALRAADVELPACILKCNMVLAGKQWPEQSTPDEVGAATAAVLREHVPAELAGVVFLSGGQGVEQATENLAAIEKAGAEAGGFPWPVTFSFARALQGPAMKTWGGDNKNAPAAQMALQERLKANAEVLF